MMSRRQMVAPPQSQSTSKSARGLPGAVVHPDDNTAPRLLPSRENNLFTHTPLGSSALTILNEAPPHVSSAVSQKESMFSMASASSTTSSSRYPANVMSSPSFSIPPFRCFDNEGGNTRM